MGGFRLFGRIKFGFVLAALVIAVHVYTTTRMFGEQGNDDDDDDDDNNTNIELNDCDGCK